MGSEEFECTDGTVAGRITCILTYGGGGVDVAINYFLLLVNLIYCASALVTASLEFQRCALGAFIFVVSFQVVLCLILGCSGISIIWCAMAGWIMSQRRFETKEANDGVPASTSSTRDNLLSRMARLVILMDFFAMTYYWIIAEAITTVAHICALALGSALWVLASRFILVQGTDRQPLMTT
jgi:hypothetical protein